MLTSKRSKTFDYSLDYKSINFRETPEKYQVGIGEQGVLLIEPYKSEILPFWKFKTPEIAEISAKKIYELFLEYRQNNDFGGMDMARKFIQMGVTRSRRYANHRSGRKYDSKKKIMPIEYDEVKAKCAVVFGEYLTKIKDDEVYTKLMKQYKQKILLNKI